MFLVPTPAARGSLALKINPGCATHAVQPVEEKGKFFSATVDFDFDFCLHTNNFFHIPRILILIPDFLLPPVFSHHFELSPF